MPQVDTRRGMHRGTGAEPAAPAAPAGDEIWFERTERSPLYPLQFRTKGHGPIHTLVPLSLIMDERYSVYLRKV